MANIHTSVNWAIGIANDNTHGYDQTNRNGPDYDCSSFVSTALNNGGFNISPSSWTGNMRSQLIADGWTEKPINAERKLGHVFLNEQHHVVLCIDSSRIVQASINENGGTTGGQTGDQTGTEIYVRNFYTPSYGWDYHLVPPSYSYINEPAWHTKPTGGYEKTTQEAIDNCTLISSILIYYGWSLKSIAAMLGSGAGESGLNPWRWEGDYVPTVQEAYAWTPAQMLQHGYGLWQFTYFTKYVDYARNLPGYGPNFSDRTGSNTDGQAQTIFMNNSLDDEWTHNLHDYYYDDFQAIGVNIDTFYYMTLSQFKEGNFTIAELVGAYVLDYLKPADWAAANSYSFRVQSAEYWYDFLINADIPIYHPPTNKFKIMFYLKPNYKKRGS